MATRAKLPVAAAPDVVGQILLLPVESITVGKRLRPVDSVWAAALGKIVKRDGQKTPIEVCKLPGRHDWMLVAGLHRLTGHQLEGIAYIRAVEVENDANARLDREISENLDRLDLDPLGRAAFIAERVAQLKMQAGIDPNADGRAVSAAARWQKQVQTEAEDANATIADAYGWTDQVADRLNLSRRTIEYDLMLHRRIPAGIVARLREADHPALRNAAQLRTLAKLDEDKQAAAIDRLLWAEQAGEARKPMTLAEACAAGLEKNKGAKTAGDKHYSAVLGAFARMGVAEKKGALAALADLLPAGYKLTFGEQFDPRGYPETSEEERDAALGKIDTARELIDGLIDDEIVTGERLAALDDANWGLQDVRMAIVADRFGLRASGDRA